MDFMILESETENLKCVILYFRIWQTIIKGLSFLKVWIVCNPYCNFLAYSKNHCIFAGNILIAQII